MVLGVAVRMNGVKFMSGLLRLAAIVGYYQERRQQWMQNVRGNGNRLWDVNHATGCTQSTGIVLALTGGRGCWTLGLFDRAMPPLGWTFREIQTFFRCPSGPYFAVIRTPVIRTSACPVE